ncbi:MAG: hypothetical protein KGL34_01460 [Gammaproteobacteria bacterium]|nr:hypothetical protein [Gammaproteobacteria bacterium]MDE2304199.1 hypothetical protein [Gammaproteobacteria bacterium]
MRIVTSLVLGLLLGTVAGCATTAPGAGASSAASAESSAPASATVRQKAAIQAAIRAGYELKQRDGQPLYCREETPIGTRFSQLHCYTVDQLVAAQRDRDQLHDMLARPQTCGGSLCVAQ